MFCASPTASARTYQLTLPPTYTPSLCKGGQRSFTLYRFCTLFFRKLLGPSSITPRHMSNSWLAWPRRVLRPWYHNDIITNEKEMRFVKEGEKKKKREKRNEADLEKSQRLCTQKLLSKACIVWRQATPLRVVKHSRVEQAQSFPATHHSFENKFCRLTIFGHLFLSFVHPSRRQVSESRFHNRRAVFLQVHPLRQVH